MGAPVDIHYLVLKPIEVGSHGEYVHLKPGDTIDSETAHAWGHVVDRMVDMGKIAPMPVYSDEWLLEQVRQRGLVPGGSGAEEGSGAGDAAPSDLDDSDEADVEGAHPRHVGGGVWELSDGRQLKGKRAALAAQAELLEG